MCLFPIILGLVIILVNPKNVDVKMKLLEIQSFPSALNFAVRSRIFPQYPNLLFVTTRGSGLSVFNIIQAEKPQLIARWEESKTVEGIDLYDTMLVLVDLSQTPALWVLNISGVEKGNFKTLGFVRMPTGVCSLHVNLFLEGMMAVVSNNGHYWKDGKWMKPSNPKPTGIIIVDINNPYSPQISSVLSLDQIDLPEGVFVISSKSKEYVLVGGYGDSDEKAVIVDISDPLSPYVASQLSQMYYKELNSLVPENEPEFVYSALYGTPGGLAVFNVKNIPIVEEVSHLVNLNFSTSNRVNMHPTKPLLFLPLENLSGIGVVDVSDVYNLRQAGLGFVPTDEEKVFCLAIHPNGNYIYVFGAFTRKMFIYTLEFE